MLSRTVDLHFLPSMQWCYHLQWTHISNPLCSNVLTYSGPTFLTHYAAMLWPTFLTQYAVMLSLAVDPHFLPSMQQCYHVQWTHISYPASNNVITYSGPTFLTQYAAMLSLTVDPHFLPSMQQCYHLQWIHISYPVCSTVITYRDPHFLPSLQQYLHLQWTHISYPACKCFSLELTQFNSYLKHWCQNHPWEMNSYSSLLIYEIFTHSSWYKIHEKLMKWF